ncbi:hypothetical protein L798_12541 [Zootermopsis nevadensis]|uniref:Uncharacterized protein n=1 Tax=Zootermopsis nevadensis TaxID=136037 RepID=A0A067QE77_ZOONE|nr:hypothetical protein L798_12541 [Zootermopsis nevadensis]
MESGGQYHKFLNNSYKISTWVILRGFWQYKSISSTSHFYKLFFPIADGNIYLYNNADENYDVTIIVSSGMECISVYSGKYVAHESLIKIKLILYNSLKSSNKVYGSRNLKR